MTGHFLTLVWNPSEGIDLGFFIIRYYSLMFVIAFGLGWYLMKKIFIRENEPLEKLDSLFVYTVLATLIGARMGHVLFYQPELFREDFWSVFLPIRTKPELEFTGFSGLASHGAAIAIIITMYYFSKKVMKQSLLWILDRVVIPIACGGIFVRIGNFMNSEILGKETSSSFGIKFIHDALSKRDVVNQTQIPDYKEAYKAIAENPQYANILEIIPAKHPAQLYEAFGYVIVFFILYYLYWKTNARLKQGYIFGVFLILLWSVRFIVEFIKESQGGFESSFGGILTTGQWLSIPFILAGIFLVARAKKTV